MTQNKFSDIPKPIVFITLAALVYFPLFSHLGAFPIRIWDESRLANNAFEMLNTHNYIVTHHGGEPDMWNTKPPLMVWLQVLCMKVFGVGELAVRLPSAIAAFLTCIVLVVFCSRYLVNKWMAFITVMVLITSVGYIEFHVARNGDYDSLLTLFTTIYGLAFFLFCEKRQAKWLYVFFISLTLAALTKGVASMLFAPALVAYAVWSKQLKTILTNKHFYIGTTFFLLIAIGYYFLREAYNPGYIAAIFENELGGRFINSAEKSSGWYYFENIIGGKFDPWYLLIPFGFLTGLYGKNDSTKRLTVFCTTMIVVFFTVISLSDTKLEWYDAPLYPFLSILTAIFIYYFFRYFKSSDYFRKSLSVNFLPIAFLFLLFVLPYKGIIQKTYIPKEKPHHREFYEMSYYLRDGLRGINDLKNQTLCYEGYHAHLDFYINLMNAKGTNVHLKNWTEVQPGEIVFTYQDTIKNHLINIFDLDTLKKFNGVNTYKINERKQSNN